MALHSGSLEILIEQAKFQPDIAVALAEAIDMAITGASLVTQPVLDARVAALEVKVEARLMALRSEIKADMQEIKAELIRWVFLVMLGNVALGAGATAILNALQHAR